MMDCEVPSQNLSQHEENQGSFGIRKIVDCKLDQDGRQMYRVKWEPTWEPAENLSSCQNLINEFWSYVNKAKLNQEVVQQHRKRLKLEMLNGLNNTVSIDEFNQYKLHEDNKAEIQKLISRNTSDGENQMMSPSQILNLPQNTQNMIGMPRTASQNIQMSPNINQQMRPLVGSPQQFNSPQRAKASVLHGNRIDMKQDSDENSSQSSKGKSSNTSSLKYIENFQNPYVKIIVVCKVCNKEQSLKFAHNWKTHYLSHVSNEEKPHKCHMCPKAFITAPQLKKHLLKHEKSQYVDSKMKLEQ